MNILKPESFEDVSIDLEAKSELHKEGLAKDYFCTYWGAGKMALSLAHDMVKNPIVKLIIKCCIFLGNGIYDRVCKANNYAVQK